MLRPGRSVTGSRTRPRRDLWPRWCRVLGSAWSRRATRSDREAARVVDALGPSTATLEYRLGAMAKGYSLMRAAHLDFEPSIGCGRVSAHPSRLDRLRGLQWRLVMSVAGFEMFLRGRCGREEKIWKLVASAVSLVSIPPPPPLPRPLAASGGLPASIESLLDIPHGPSDRSRLAEHLGLNKFEEELLLGWLQGTREPAGWEGHVRLAAALRNVTAHGALSAKKVGELRLRGAFGALPIILFDFAGATLEGPVMTLEAAALARA